eukprot:jgi/Mesen1/660/ME000109S10874
MEILKAALGHRARAAVTAGGTTHSYADILRASSAFADKIRRAAAASSNEDSSVPAGTSALLHHPPGSPGYPPPSHPAKQGNKEYASRGNLSPSSSTSKAPGAPPMPAGTHTKPVGESGGFSLSHLKATGRCNSAGGVGAAGEDTGGGSRHEYTCRDGIGGAPSRDGPRVGIYSTPTPEFVAALCATWQSGGVAVPLATSHPHAELLHVLQDAQVSVLIGSPEHRSLLQPLARETSADYLELPPVSSTASVPAGTSSAPGGPFDSDLLTRSLRDFDASSCGREAALLVYTSGTTGRPKGVVHTHQGFAAQARVWGSSLTSGATRAHVHGLSNALAAPLYAGSSVEFLPRFSASAVWARWRESYAPDQQAAPDTITVFTGVPTMYVRLLQAYESMPRGEQRASAEAARQLRLMMCGSAACPEPLMRAWARVTGHTLLERYGMTEFGMGLSNPLHGERRVGFVGAPLPGVEAKIAVAAVDSASEPKKAELALPQEPLPRQQEEEEEEGELVGELCIRSPSMFREYWGLPEATAKEFDEDGFFRTGDTATLSHGLFKILGRTSVDVLKVGGFKVSALEIEATLLQHPQVDECAVLGVSDAHYGQKVAAVVVLAADPTLSQPGQSPAAPAAAAAAASGSASPAPGSSAPAAANQNAVPSAEELQEWARSHLAIYKCAVLGVSDAHYGQKVAAVVVLAADPTLSQPGQSPAAPAAAAAAASGSASPAPGSSAPAAANQNAVPSAEELQEWARSHLAIYKVPQIVCRVDSIPRNAMGKVNKKELLKQLFPV